MQPDPSPHANHYSRQLYSVTNNSVWHLANHLAFLSFLIYTLNVMSYSLQIETYSHVYAYMIIASYIILDVKIPTI